MKNPKNIHWLQIVSGFYWQTQVSGVRLGTDHILGYDNSYGTGLKNAIFDTSVSIIYAPASKTKMLDLIQRSATP